MSRSVVLTFGVALTSLSILTGCNGSDDGDYHVPEGGHEVVDEPHDHGHDAGPHGGHLIELGEEEYHAEIVFDSETRKTTVYILGPDAESPHAITAGQIELHLHVGEQESEFMLSAAPLESDGEGKSSRFELPADKMPESIKDEEDFEGEVHLKIGEKEYTGKVAHDHDGDHGKHDGDTDSHADETE